MGTPGLGPARVLCAALLIAAIGGGCSRGKNPGGATNSGAGGESLTPAAVTFKTIMQDYNTAASQHLRRLETDFNSDLPANTYQGTAPLAPILYLDYDQISTWYVMSDGPDTVEDAIDDYLMVRTGHPATATGVAILSDAMNRLDAEGVLMQRNGGGNCLVVPEYPGISFGSFYAASLAGAAALPGGAPGAARQPQQSDPLAKATITIGMTTPEFQDFVNAHESWHCLDIRYIRDTGDGLEGAVKQNRAEMFADIGAAMEAVRNGADLSLIDKAAALRATWSLATGPAHARLEQETALHFSSVAYATQGGLDALKARISQMGVDNFRKLRREQMRAIDYELTDAYCLTYEQAGALQSYFLTYRAGDVAQAARALPASPPAAAPVLARMKALAAASIRPATPAEMAARDRVDQEAADFGGLNDQLMLGQLRARAAALGSITSLANDLQARQEFTDSLRQKLVSDPATEKVTEAQLTLLLYTDPRLNPRADSK